MNSFFRLIRIAYQQEKNFFIKILIISMIQPLPGFISLILLQNVINSVQRNNVSATFFYFTIYGTMLVANYILGIYHTKTVRIFDLKISQKIHILLLEKCNNLGLKDYEASETYDQIGRAFRESQRLSQCVTTPFSLVTSVISFVSYSMVVVLMNPKAFMLIITFPIVSFFITCKMGNYEFEISQARSESQRKMNYFQRLLSNQISFKENKSLNIDKKLLDKYTDFSTSFINKDTEILTKKLWYTLILKIFEVAAALFIIFRILMSALNGEILLGNVYSNISAIWNVINSADATSKNLYSIYQQMLYISNLFVFLDKPESKRGTKRIDSINSIEFKNVSFKYKEDLPYVIRNISFKIDKGEKVAILGKNGSGKTTVFKLIMGLYTEFEGEILINGIPINDIDKVSYYRCLGVVFQDFVRYEFPVDESLLLGNERENVDEGEILQKAKDEGLLGFISKLPNGRKTQLGSNFSSGVQLSGGQWQQITLSRVLNRESDLYIMDEPTSSFDILTEKKIANLIGGLDPTTTLLYISHRLYNLSQLVDKAIIFQQGRIVDITNLHDYQNDEAFVDYITKYFV